MKEIRKNLKTNHRFLDESGDCVFYGKGNKLIVGDNGVSKTFILGSVKFKENLDDIRSGVVDLQRSIINDEYVNNIPSVLKRENKGGFFFHAKDDIPEIREKFFKFINTLNCSFEAIVARKIPAIYASKHSSNESYFYADLLSHLLKNKLSKSEKLVLNIATRGKTTKNKNLILALEKAKQRIIENSVKPILTDVKFNVVNQTSEPLLNIADYFCWSIQNVFERGSIRHYNFLLNKISTVIDIYDINSYNKVDKEGKKIWANYYGPKNPLTAENKISPLSH